MNYAETPTDEILHSFSVDVQRGLVQEQISEYKKKYGPNTLTKQREATIFERILRELVNPLVLILLVAFVLTVILHEYIDAAVVLLAIIVNVTVTLIQEGKANNAFKVLQEKRTHTAQVVRDGKKQEYRLMMWWSGTSF